MQYNAKYSDYFFVSYFSETTAIVIISVTALSAGVYYGYNFLTKVKEEIIFKDNKELFAFMDENFPHLIALQNIDLVSPNLMNNYKFYVLLINLVEMMPNYSAFIFDLNAENSFFIEFLWVMLRK